MGLLISPHYSSCCRARPATSAAACWMASTRRWSTALITPSGPYHGITDAETVRMWWLGHRLSVEATATSDPAMPVGRFHQLQY
jgi:hypothetical protein